MKIKTEKQWNDTLYLVTQNLKEAYDLLDISWEQLEELGAKDSSSNMHSAKNMISNAIHNMFHRDERQKALDILRTPSLEELYAKRDKLNEEIEDLKRKSK